MRQAYKAINTDGKENDDHGGGGTLGISRSLLVAHVAPAKSSGDTRSTSVSVLWSQPIAVKRDPLIPSGGPTVEVHKHLFLGDLYIPNSGLVPP